MNRSITCPRTESLSASAEKKWGSELLQLSSPCCQDLCLHRSKSGFPCPLAWWPILSSFPEASCPQVADMWNLPLLHTSTAVTEAEALLDRSSSSLYSCEWEPVTTGQGTGDPHTPHSSVPLNLHHLEYSPPIPHQHHRSCFPFSPLALRGDGKPTRLIRGFGSQEGLFWKTPNWLRQGFLSEPGALATCMGSWGERLMPHRKCPHCLLPSSTARPPLLDERLPWWWAQHRAWPGSAPVNIHSFLPHPQQNMARSPGARQPLSLATAQVHWSHLLWAMLWSREELRQADGITHQAGEGAPNLG